LSQDPREVCARYRANFSPPDSALKVGISASAVRGEFPLHGLRHPPNSGTSGWFIWSGDLSEAHDFFLPYHLSHLAEDCPAALPYLALPPGWRFLIAPGYEDVWFDESLFDV
jgi:hypothetical protein